MVVTPERVLYDDGTHQCYLLEDYGHGQMVQTNVYLIVDNKKGMLLDPGGHKLFKPLFSDIAQLIGIQNLEYIFLSHQDPDIVAGLNGWLMTSQAVAIISKWWLRFIPHYGLDKYVEPRLKGIEDDGGIIKLGNSEIFIIPGHFMHSPGNFQVYDPVAKILYSGDMFFSFGVEYTFVDEPSALEVHLERFVKPYVQRFMGGRQVFKPYARLLREIDEIFGIEVIAPQHGAIIRGRENVLRTIEWLENLEAGPDIIGPIFQIPKKRLVFD
ncbi:MAG: MBL fold metallo-hydrolase [Aquificae bacterium]|nr:MBL fold metallo-hydrolase [Aquificota bacterium]